MAIGAVLIILGVIFSLPCVYVHKRVWGYVLLAKLYSHTVWFVYCSSDEDEEFNTEISDKEKYAR